MEDFDFDARCNVIGFEMARTPRSGDVQVLSNEGARYSPATRRMVNLA